MWLTQQHTLKKLLENIIPNPFGFSLEFPALVEANASLDGLQAKPSAKWNVEKNADPAILTRTASARFKQVKNPKKLARNTRTHSNLTNPEARLSHKPNKPFRLYYLSSMSAVPAGIDTACHVITHIQADSAAVADH